LLPYLPGSIVDRWRVRHILSKLVAKLYGYTGYFEMYAMPFDRIHYFDYIEKTDMFVPNGIKPVKNLADKLEEKGIPYHISNWRLKEIENIEALIKEIEEGEIRFAFLYTAAMDGLLHMVTKDGKEIDEKIEWYSGQIQRVIEAVKKRYDDFYFAVLSDHGMTTLAGVVDVKSQVEGLGLKFGEDYVAVYDSTMGRFWFLNKQAEERILNLLHQVPHSHVLSEEEEKKYDIDFENHMYGEKYLLMDPGWQIEPCDMGIKALPAMHGFAPEHEDSYAALLSSEPVDIPLNCVDDFHHLMVKKMEGLT